MKRQIKVELILEIEDGAILCLDDEEMAHLVEEGEGIDSFTKTYIKSNFLDALNGAYEEDTNVGAHQDINCYAKVQQIDITILE